MKRTLLLIAAILSLCQLHAEQRAKTGDIQFIENKGQWDHAGLFTTAVYGGQLFLERNAFTYAFSNISEVSEWKHSGEKFQQSPFTLKEHAFSIQFTGSDPMCKVSGEDKLDNYYNFFQGDDETKWRGKVPAFTHVNYSGLYPGIDMSVYSRSNDIKYDLIVSPGASVNLVRFTYVGVDAMTIEEGNLVITTSINKLMELKPVAWQMINGEKQMVECNFTLQDNTVGFAFPNGYNKNYTLIIDPATLIFASYSGSFEDNWGYTATYDDDGNLYGGGIAFNNGYPVTLGAFSTTFTGPVEVYMSDVTLSKFTADGTSLVYSTYLGGSGQDLPYSVIVNDDDELIVYGSTGSSNFPTVSGSYDVSFNGGTSITVDFVLGFSSGSDVFVTKFSADGSSLIGSTYLGGSANDALNIGVTGYNYGDHARGEVNLDADGNILVATSTRSANFPITVGAFQTTIGGDQDGVVFRLNPNLTTLQWSSYLGGSGTDGAYSIKEMNDDKILVCGGTASDDLDATVGAYQENYVGGTTDGFLATLKPNGSEILHLTYLGTSLYDQAFLVEVDAEDHIYVTGQTRGAFPVVGDVYSNAGSSQFIAKLDSTLSDIIISTVYGDGDNVVNISPTAFLVDNCGNIYVAGWGGTVNIGYNFETGYVTDLPITGDAFQSSTDGSDFYLIVFSADLEALSYASFFGGPFSQEHVDGGTSRFDKSGVVYEAVCAGCGSSDDFPTSEGVVSNTNNSDNCNLGVFKFALAAPLTTAAAIANPDTGCVDLFVEFTNSSFNAIGYSWDFGDGATSTEFNPTHTYTEPGTYIITLIAYAVDGCGLNDTTQITVTALTNPIAAFTYSPEIANVFQPVVFEDASTAATEWLWEFGDGFTSTEQNPSHVYADTGTYYVCLTVSNDYSCTDKICDSVIISALSILEVPNAFSPNGDGTNDIFIPVNYGLLNYEFRIYNRWGELIFITNDPTKGWDGYYNGVEQELDVYVYVVSGNGEDGVHYSKQGNITLVR